MPTPSWPGTNGGDGFTGQSPWAAWMSVWQRPDASTARGPGRLQRHGARLLDAKRLREVVDDRGAVGRGAELRVVRCSSVCRHDYLLLSFGRIVPPSRRTGIRDRTDRAAENYGGLARAVAPALWENCRLRGCRS